MSKLTNILKSPLNLFKSSKVTAVSKRVSTGNSILDSLKSKEVRKKLLFTFGIVVVYRFLSAVPLPGIDVQLFTEAFGGNPLNNFFTLVTGGRLDNPSIVAIGLGAYINASIIIQLLTTVIPKLEELSKEGERGRQTINQYTRILGVPLAVVQSFVIYTILSNVGQSSPQLAGLVSDISTFDLVTMILALTAGSVILMWLGELITEYGLGNGVSIIITLGILSSLPGLISNDFHFIKPDLSLLANGNLNVLLNENLVILYLVLAAAVLLIVGIVYVNEAIRKIPIQYARRVRGTDPAGGNFLPLKINQAGVIPVIFASAVLTFPQIIAQLLVNAADAESILYKIGTAVNESFLVTGSFRANGNQLFDQTNFFYYQLFYVLLIVGFTFFYTFVTYKPSDTADNLKKSGGFIPGLRPGKATEKFVTHVLVRLATVGAIFLALVSILPNMINLLPISQNITIFSGIGGTSLLIVVGVTLDTIRQMKSLTVSKSYDQYK